MLVTQSKRSEVLMNGKPPANIFIRRYADDAAGTCADGKPDV